MNRNELRSMYRNLGPSEFTKRFYETLGLYDYKEGKRRVNTVTGESTLESQALKPDSFSLLQMYRAIVGDDDGEMFVRSANRTMSRDMLLDKSVNVMEDGGVEIGPSQFANVSAYNAAALGLLEAKFLEAYRRPDFLADQLASTVPTDKIQEKFIGISMVGDVAEERRPGDRHARFNLSERYVTTPNGVNNGLAVDVTREAIMFDRTRAILKQAETGADVLALRKEYRILDAFLGNTNTYNYNGTSYTTYLTSGNWVNKITGAGSILTDWTQVNTALQLFAGMTDQETGQPVSVTPKDIFVMPANYLTARGIVRYTEVQRRTPNPATSQGYALEVGTGQNPLNEFQFNVIGSPTYPYAMSRLTASAANGGAALSTTNASKYWFVGEFQKAFGYIQQMPLTIQRASPSEYEMADRGLVFSLFADEFGTPCVLDPRFAVEVTGQ